jgi:hypothetical protein
VRSVRPDLWLLASTTRDRNLLSFPFGQRRTGRVAAASGIDRARRGIALSWRSAPYVRRLGYGRPEFPPAPQPCSGSRAIAVACAHTLHVFGDYVLCLRSVIYGALRFGLHASATTGPGWSFGLPPLPSFCAIQLMISPTLP